MLRLLGIALIALGLPPALFGAGILIPDDVKLQPLSMVNHIVNVRIEDQVAITTVEQTFRNQTDRNLEATYVFPIPKGASVNKFTMWVDGKETTGEILDAKKASELYTSIVQRTRDPGLLEYLGNGMIRFKVFPVPAKGDLKMKFRFTSVSPQDGGIVEYVYPLKTDGKDTRTLEKFSVTVHIQSQNSVQSIYSPTHAIDIRRKGDREATVEFEKNQATLDKDFQIFYSVGKQEVGVTPVFYRPVSGDDGYFMLLISPQTEQMKNRVPRDLVLVLDTSGSMSDLKMSQAKKALKVCLNQLGDRDRFSIVSFATAVQSFRDGLTDASTEKLEKATKWVDELRAGGGTAIQPALNAALDLRSQEAGRSFNIVFFTDGQPTVDERDPQKIVKNVVTRNTASTRIFTFGVGDDVNAAMLDQLADSTRAISTYVRPAEDIEVKASALCAKIGHPVMTNVKLTTTNVTLTEVYPQQLPDLFHGGQLVLFGRFQGRGPAAIKLTGLVGQETKELIYEVDFPTKTTEGREFVEHLWARRKVGFILDQIRINGEQKELVEEVTALAKKYGIATPYTSYLVVPDAPVPVVMGYQAQPKSDAPALAPAGAGAGKPQAVGEFAKDLAKGSKDKPGEGLGGNRGAVQERMLNEKFKELPADLKDGVFAETLKKAQTESKTLDDANRNYRSNQLERNHSGRLGVDLALASNTLRGQARLSQTANKQLLGRNCVEFGGVWIDDRFTDKTKTLSVKAQSEAYFRILEKQPTMKDVFQLGNHLVWIAPNGTALIIDANEGTEKLEDRDIDALFVAGK